MRAGCLFVLALLALPLVDGQAPGPRHDLIVTLAADATTPDDIPGAIRVHAFPALVVPDAPAGLADALRATPGVARVDVTVPLERHASGDLNLRLTRAHAAADGIARFGATGRGVTVAVIDSGVDPTHPDLVGRVPRNVKLVDGDFLDAPGDTDGHGTHVAGIVAANGASSDGRIVGVAPNASIVGVDISQRFTTASALLAYDWLFVHRESIGVDVVVNAWGRVGDDPFDASDPVVRAIDALVGAGVVVVFSASNHGPDAASLSLEAQNPRVITVGAVDAAARIMDYSSRGPVRGDPADAWVKPDLVAPGEGIVGLRSLQAAPDPRDPDALHRTLSGTSQAAPHVAGIVALMLEANATLAPRDVANALRASAVDLGARGPDDATGFGLVDARDAIRQALGQPNDRGNPLVAGGTERYADETRLGAAAPRGLLGLGRAAQGEPWTMPFAVKPGAQTVAVDVSWGAPASGARVAVARGDVVVGSWSSQGGDDVRGRLDDPTPGVYTLRVSSAAPIELDVLALVQVQLSANATRALELDSRYRLPEESATAEESTWSVTPGGAVLPWALALVALAFASARPRRPREP